VSLVPSPQVCQGTGRIPVQVLDNPAQGHDCLLAETTGRLDLLPIAFAASGQIGKRSPATPHSFCHKIFGRKLAFCQ
jgi:hypothetical protein